MSRNDSSNIILSIILICGLIIPGVIFSQQADSLHKILSKQDRKDKVLTYLHLAEFYTEKHPIESEAYLDTALLMAKQYKYDSLISVAAYKKGRFALQKGMITEARKYFQNAYLYFNREGNEKAYSNLLDLLGETYARMNRLDTAFLILQKSLDLKLGINDTAGIAGVYIKLGNVNYLNGNLDRALSYYQQSLGKFKMLGDKHGLATTSMNLGNIFEELGKLDSAKYFYYTALQLNKVLGDYQHISILLNNLGVYHSNQGNIDSSIYYLTRSSEAAEKINDHYQIAVLKNNIGLIQDKKGDYKRALETYQEALDLAKANKYTQLQRSIYKNLAGTYAHTGAFKKAYEAHTMFAELNDSITNLETKERISNLQLEFEEKREIEDIRARSDLKQLRYTYLIAVLLAALLLIVIFFIIIFRNSLHRKRVNEELLEKNREASQQKELQELTLKELVENQKKTRAILNALPDVMFIFDKDGNYLDYHAKSEEDIIKSEEKLLGSNIKKELSEVFAGKILQAISKAAEDGQVQVFIHRDEINGRMMDMELRVAPIEDGSFLMIGRNITKRKEMERELKEARDEMQKALETKSMYLASLSHEIRTPLTSIIGVTSILEETDLSEEQEECTNIINISSNNLLNLINNILDFSRIESGQIKLEKVEVVIHEVIEEVVSLLEVKAKDSNNKITYEIDPALKTGMVGDPYRLTQILINLVNNAIKFTKNGNIQIHVSLQEKKAGSLRLRFEVSDTGIGVSVEQRDKLFKAFSQADESIARKYGGSGLGLVISKHFVQLMGGEIGLESEEGKGSKFWFTAIFQEEGKTGNPPLENHQEKVAQDEDEQSGKKDILLVEDNLLNQKFALAILKKQNHHVDIAENGKIGVEFFKEKSYNVILMDIQMPVMDGIQATKNIRRIEAEKNLEPTRIVAVTAYAMEGDEDKFYQAGIDDYLRKPYKAHQLLEKLEAGSTKDENL